MHPSFLHLQYPLQFGPTDRTSHLLGQQSKLHQFLLLFFFPAIYIYVIVYPAWNFHFLVSFQADVVAYHGFYCYVYVLKLTQLSVDLLWLLIRPDMNRKYCRTMSWMMYNRHGTIHAFGLIFYLYIHLLLCFFNPISIPMSLFWKYIYKKHFLVSRCTADFLLHRAFFIYGNITWFIYLIATIIWAFTLSYSWFLCLTYSFVQKLWIFVDSLEQSFWSYSLDIGCFFI